MKFTKNIFFKNVSVLFLGTVISQAINIGGLPILSRMYGIGEFGNLALFMAIGSIILSFSTLQLDLAIVKTENLKERLTLIPMAFSSVLFSAIFASLGIWIWSIWNEQINFLFILLGFIFFISNAGNQILIYFFNSEKKYKNIAIARIVLALCNLILALLIFFLNKKSGLIIAITGANLIVFLVLVLFFSKKIKLNKLFKTEGWSSIFHKNIKFIKYNTPSTFLDVIAYQIIIIVLAEYFSEELTGSFFMAMRVVLLPAALIGTAISQVFYKDISDKFSKGNLSNADFWNIWKLLVLVGGVPFGFLYFFGSEIFEFILGEEWVLAGKIASILAIKGFVNFFSSPTSSGFTVINQQQYNLRLTIIRCLYTTILLFVAIENNDFFFFLSWYVFFEVIHMLTYNGLIIYNLSRLKVEK